MDSLFAGDTTEIGDKEELEEGVAVVKEVMGRFEERNNDGKEEVLDFGTEEAEGVRMLGSWVGWKKDIESVQQASSREGPREEQMGSFGRLRNPSLTSIERQRRRRRIRFGIQTPLLSNRISAARRRLLDVKSHSETRLILNHISSEL